MIVGLGLSCQKDLIKNFCIDTVNNLKAIVGIDCALVLADLLMIFSMVYVLAAKFHWVGAAQAHSIRAVGGGSVDSINGPNA